MRLRIFTEPQQGATYATVRRLAQAAEDLGFDAFFRSDHYLKMGNVSGQPGPSDAWTTLAGLALETSRIRLGTLVSSATFRYPGPLAVTVAQVDEMSGGRIEFGLGAGWYAAEHAAYGIPFPATGERFGRLEEQLAVITGLWDTPTGSEFSFEGKYYQVSDSPALPKPTQQPHPPIIVGGHGPRRTPALAAKYADEFNIGFSNADVVAEQFARVREACTAAGRDPSALVYSAAQTIVCGKDDAAVARRAEAIGRDVDELRADGLAGTPDEIVAKVGTFAEIGTQALYLQVLDLDDLDHVAEIAAGVLPRV